LSSSSGGGATASSGVESMLVGCMIVAGLWWRARYGRRRRQVTC
jgi:hypothetical protein